MSATKAKASQIQMFSDIIKVIKQQPSNANEHNDASFPDKTEQIFVVVGDVKGSGRISNNSSIKDIGRY